METALPASKADHAKAKRDAEMFLGMAIGDDAKITNLARCYLDLLRVASIIDAPVNREEIEKLKAALRPKPGKEPA